jgi:hypothetical protein
MSCLRYIHFPHSHRDQRVNVGWKIIVIYYLNYRIHANAICKIYEILMLGHVVEVVKTALKNYIVTL